MTKTGKDAPLCHESFLEQLHIAMVQREGLKRVMYALLYMYYLVHRFHPALAEGPPTWARAVSS